MATAQSWLVTGGAGFIGSHLVESLLAGGHQVTVLDDLSTGSRANLAAVEGNPRLRIIEGKVSAYPGLAELVDGMDGVYHLAAAVGVELVVRSPIRTIQTNLDETEAILAAASRRKVPVLLASTSEVYGKSLKEEFSEEDDLLIGPPHLGRWSYACSKLMDEFLGLAYARERGLPVVIARIFNTVGPRQTGRYGMVLPRFLAAARTGQPLRVFGDGRQTRCFCYVGDTVTALRMLLEVPAARGQVVNVGATREVTILELAQQVISAVGGTSSIEFVSYDEAYAPGFEDMQRRRPATGKLLHLTGFQPSVSLEEIIQRTAGAGPVLGR